MNLVLAVLSGFAAAFAVPALPRFARGASSGWVVALLPLGLATYFATLSGTVVRGERVAVSYDWVPSLGVGLSFQLDGLSLLFSLLICGIGSLVFIYAGSYLEGHPRLGRFYSFLLAFMASMLGLVLADNVITLFVFWELTSISSYLLIGFGHEEESSRSSALQALLVTSGGGLALLAGLVLLAQAGGTYELSSLLEAGERVRASSLYPAILVLVLAGAFTKSAQFPFHFWLPGAMAAPTPVSAYLHSATMVKAGVYLLARLSPALGGTDAWFYAVTGAGAATMIVGGVLALYQTDLKRVLAFSTVSALGTLVMLTGLGTPGAAKAMIVFLLAHALYKGALFMVAGALDHETGTRDVERLGGLRQAMPFTAGVALLAAVSLAGVGPVLSFIGKELMLEAVLEAGRGRDLLVPVAVLAGALFVAVAGIVAIRPFFGERKETPKSPHEAPLSLRTGPAVLAVLGLLIGLAPGPVNDAVVTPAVASVLGASEAVKLTLWHGFNPALVLSLVSLAAGLLVFRGWEALRRKSSALEKAFEWGPARWYGATLAGVNAAARAQTRALQNGRLRIYLLVTVAATVGLVGFVLLTRVSISTPGGLSELTFYEVGIAVLIMAATGAAVRARTRLTAIAALGVIGACVALIFVIYGAPDLAMTQIMIETLTVILLVLVFYHLPRYALLSGPATRARDALVAGAAGVLMTALVFVVSQARFAEPISGFYAERSYPDGHGRNIVNVILVDFRGLDTLGEITVLGIAGVGVYALLRLRWTAPKGGEG